MNSKTLKGIYKIKHPEKYVGNNKNIVYRSSYELAFFRLLDESANILNWSSEELAIPYYDPIKGYKRRYFPDVLLRQKNKDGSISKILIEIKPSHEIFEPKKKPKQSMESYLKELATYTTNRAKWTAAKKWCEDHGCQFVIVTRNDKNRFHLLTENQIFNGR